MGLQNLQNYQPVHLSENPHLPLFNFSHISLTNNVNETNYYDVIYVFLTKERCYKLHLKKKSMYT